ncbi:hypothetical protein ISS08_00835 [Candidatus Pacearchaeota archaeon]|nr:hypothetical protein [Candidatus Pacearchaeota archaeon]
MELELIILFSAVLGVLAAILNLLVMKKRNGYKLSLTFLLGAIIAFTLNMILSLIKIWGSTDLTYFRDILNLIIILLISSSLFKMKFINH